VPVRLAVFGGLQLPWLSLQCVAAGVFRLSPSPVNYNALAIGWWCARSLDGGLAPSRHLAAFWRQCLFLPWLPLARRVGARCRYLCHRSGSFPFLTVDRLTAVLSPLSAMFAVGEPACGVLQARDGKRSYTSRPARPFSSSVVRICWAKVSVPMGVSISSATRAVVIYGQRGIRYWP
jgi:hypothetical protein